MVVIVLFFSSAIASAWGAIHDVLMHKCLEVPGLGTVLTDDILLQADAGDSTVLLKCRCEGLGLTGHANAQTSGSTGPWQPRHGFHFSQGRCW